MQLQNQSLVAVHNIPRPKIGNREKHQDKHRKCPNKQGKDYVKRGEKLEEMGENMWGIAVYEYFLNTQSLVLKPFHIQTEQPENVGESPLFFPHTLFCKLIRYSQHAARWQTGSERHSSGCTRQMSFDSQLQVMERYKVGWFSG